MAHQLEDWLFRELVSNGAAGTAACKSRHWLPHFNLAGRARNEAQSTPHLGGERRLHAPENAADDVPGGDQGLDHVPRGAAGDKADTTAEGGTGAQVLTRPFGRSTARPPAHSKHVEIRFRFARHFNGLKEAY